MSTLLDPRCCRALAIAIATCLLSSGAAAFAPAAHRSAAARRAAALQAPASASASASASATPSVSASVSASWMWADALGSPGLRRRASASPVCMAMPRGRNQRPKPVVDNTPINEAIDFEEVRVVLDVPGATDELLGVMSKTEAIQAAIERELDLVLIGPKSDPPVCKIVSYDKFRFLKEKKKKEQQKAVKGQELKELKMSYKIGEHDYDVRKRAAERFLSQGNKVKFSILFKGREITHASVGKEIMDRMAMSLEPIGSVDSPPKVMGRQMIMTVSPKKMPGAK